MLFTVLIRVVNKYIRIYLVYEINFVLQTEKKALATTHCNLEL